MPELPDITIYLEALERRILRARLDRLRLTSPFVLRSASVAPAELEGRTVTGLRRMGKRIVILSWRRDGERAGRHRYHSFGQGRTSSRKGRLTNG